MKRLMFIVAVFLMGFGLAQAQTEWQGRVARGGSLDFPTEGFYAASNSFPRNTIVSVTNLATGKSVRVVISKGLSDASLFMTLSADAAKALGLDGNFPATMKALPVIVPGISDQSIGSELPYNRDPDVNPAAAAGSPASTSGAIAEQPRSRASGSDGSAVSQPPGQSMVQASAQSASGQLPAALAASPPPSASDAAQLSQASNIPVPAGRAVTELDLSASQGLAPQAEAPPSEAVSRGARLATAGTVTAPPPAAGPVELLLPGSADLVAAGAAANDLPESNQALAHPAQGQAPSPKDAATAGEATSQNLVKASDGAAGARVLEPATQLPVLPASLPQDPSVARNGLKSSPAVTGLAPVAPSAAQAQDAGSTGASRLLPAATAQVSQSANPAQANQAAEPALPAAAGSGTGLLAGLRAGAPRNPSGLSGQSGGPAAPSGSAIQAGASGIGARSLGTNVGVRPGTASPELPAASAEPPRSLQRGLGSGVQAMGNKDRSLLSLGDVARPDHSFDPPLAAAAPKASGLSLMAPKAQQPGAAAAAAGSAALESQLDKQIALAQARNSGRDLFPPAQAEDDISYFPSARPDAEGKLAASLPSAKAPKTARPDASLAELSAGVAAARAGSLPLASVQAAEKPDNPLERVEVDPAAALSAELPSALPPGVQAERPQGSLAGLSPAAGDPNALALVSARLPEEGGAEPSNPGLAAQPGIDPASGLPIAVLPGADRPEASNPWLEGAVGFSGQEPGLPVAALVPGDLPQPGLPGESPAIALVPGKSDLPLAAVASAGPVLDPSLGAAQPASVAGLEPAELRPPLLGTGSAEASLAAAPPSGQLAGVPVLSYPQIRAEEYESSLSAALAPADPLNEPYLAIATLPGGASDESLIAALRPEGQSIDGRLVTPVRPMPESLAGPQAPDAGPAPQVALATPDSQKPEAGKQLSAPGAVVPDRLATATAPAAATVDQGLPPRQGGTDTSTNVAVTPAQPTVVDKKPVDTKPVETKPADTKPADTKPADTKPADKKPSDTKPVVADAKPADTKPADTKPADTKVTLGNTADEQWAQGNLPLVRSLQKSRYYVQVGAFANPRSAKVAIDEVAKGYQAAVLPEKQGSKPVYKVFIGPLTEDEKGLLLYIFRSKGYRDAFIKQGQP